MAKRLGGSEWLEEVFSAGDLMMVLLLRRLDGSGIGEQYSNLDAYVACGVAQPGYQPAFEARAAVFAAVPV